MTTPRKAPMQRRINTIVAAVAVMTLGACTSPTSGTHRAEPATVERPPAVVSEAETSAPVALTIPALDLTGGLARTGLTDDNTLEVPEFGEMSWFEDGVTPGASGPAAILGHVDSRSGPDVFYRLDELSPGDEIFVDSAAGQTLEFVVRKVEQHPKDSFPTEAVWLPTPDRELRLITCGGAFDDREQSYRDNVIVFASLRPEAPGT
ncbi:sortase [Allosaccharopolyspora coralli]|uniref:Sortase n=1 Tax=Allosaccharopolyspora coralli TaxID=2665642 RepID=A0A5Q3Q9F5_9PSEU|nr:sortase [Allosaccharopolyspora coralli]QGK69834.1 sortase [Allosaccharopolyspora coralli]